QLRRDSSVRFDLGEIPHASEKAVGDARGPSGSPGNLLSAFRVQPHSQDPRRPAQDEAQVFQAVEVQMVNDSESVPKGRREEPDSGRGAQEREGREVQLDHAAADSLADGDVELVVFHGLIEDLLERRAETVKLVN